MKRNSGFLILVIGLIGLGVGIYAHYELDNKRKFLARSIRDYGTGTSEIQQLRTIKDIGLYGGGILAFVGLLVLVGGSGGETKVVINNPSETPKDPGKEPESDSGLKDQNEAASNFADVPNSSIPNPVQANKYEQIEKLAEMRDRGILSDEEFASEKQKLLNG